MRPPKPISPAEPITDLQRIPIREIGDPLVNYMELYPDLRIDRPRYTYRRETLVREPIAYMLGEANRRLPAGYYLAVVEGWRPLHIQRRMYLGIWRRYAERHPDWSETKLRRTVNRYTAPINGKVPPPHSTGAAVDMILVREDGSPHDHVTPFERFDPASFGFNAPGLSDSARRTRDILAEALSATKLTNYPSEYWHWSYGDQGWAYRGGHEHAIYAPITPTGWEPDPADVSDEPLMLLE
jgi:zinc D-Ala-D-Ala dipeptidase